MPPRKTAEKHQQGDKALVDNISHKKGCPEERTEVYTTKRPDGALLRVARCVECGEFTTKEAGSDTEEGQVSGDVDDGD